MNRIRRKIVACFSIALLLFAQLAVAAYACPNNTERMDLQLSVESQSTPKPCHGMDHKNPNLCKQYCDQSAQSVDSRLQAKIDLPVLPVAWIVSCADLRMPKLRSTPVELPPKLVTPPLYLHHCSFLI